MVKRGVESTRSLRSEVRELRGQSIRSIISVNIEITKTNQRVVMERLRGNRASILMGGRAVNVGLQEDCSEWWSNDMRLEQCF